MRLRRRSTESFRRELVDGEVEGVAASAQPLECPHEVSLHRDALRAAGGDNAEEDGCAMRAFGGGAAGGSLARAASQSRACVDLRWGQSSRPHAEGT